MNIERLNIRYSVWKSIVQQNNTWKSYHIGLGNTLLKVVSGNNQVVMLSEVDAENYSNWVSVFGSVSLAVNSEDEAIALILGQKDPQISPQTTDRLQRVAIEPTEGIRKTFITPNWGDKTTWYYRSTKHLGTVLTNLIDDFTYAIDSQGDPICIVDNYHGRYSDEDFLTTAQGDIPRAKVYQDGALMTEKDPHTGLGQYLVDYQNGRVVFDVAPSGTITMDYWEVGSSEFIVAADLGKKLKITYVEAQFSDNISITDSVLFQPRGYSHIYAPGYVQAGYLPSGILIDLGNPKIYKTMLDYINEANGVKGSVSASTAPALTWRDLNFKVVTYPWDYLASTELSSHTGLQISIKLEHDVAFSGFATATLYGLSYDAD